MKQLIGLSLMFVLGSQSGFTQFYQGSNMEFGKNRIQYKEFTWFYYPSDNFDVYYYIGGEDLAQYTLLSCERNLKEMQDFFDYPINERVQVVSYLNPHEFYQSNIGLSVDGQNNIGGSVRILGSKMFTYFEGSHHKLEVQIRENIGRLIFSQMMYSGSWRDMLRNSTLLAVPAWFEEGVIAYAASGKSTEAEIFMIDYIRSGKFKSLNFLEGRESSLAGHAFWQFIADTYGQNLIANILYMSQASNNIENGFIYVLGTDLTEITDEFIRYYNRKADEIRSEIVPTEVSRPTSKRDARRWWRGEKRLGMTGIKTKSHLRYTAIAPSPDGQMIAYATNESGRVKIYTHHLQTGKSKRIFCRGHRLERPPDEAYPLLAWHPSGLSITYTYHHRLNPVLESYDIKKRKRTRKTLYQLERVTSMEYSSDGKKMIMTAFNRGKSDLFLYHVPGNNHEQLTRDVWDETGACFADGGKTIVFSSNRNSDTLRNEDGLSKMSGNNDLFLYDLESRNPILRRLTKTPLVDEIKPRAFKENHYSFLSNENGYYNRSVANIDSTISSIDTAIHYRYYTSVTKLTDLHRHTTDHFVLKEPSLDFQIYQKNGNPWVSWGQTATSAEPKNEGNSQTSPMEKKSLIFIPEVKPVDVDIRNYIFESDRLDYVYEKESPLPIAAEPVSTDTSAITVIPKSRNYRLNFAADRAVAQLNNNFFNPIYQNYTGSNPSSISPGISGLTQFGITDLFEDYRVVGGFRANLGIDNSEYGISFENLKNQTDRKFLFSRQTQKIQQGFQVYKLISNDFAYVLKFPFTEVLSLRIRGDFRIDRLILQSNDVVSLEQPNQTDFNTAVKAELVFDNSIQRGLNTYFGTRAKAWAERYQNLDIESKNFVNIIGFDARHYHRLHRTFIAAFRLAATTSFGAQRVVNYLGGVDNWLFQRVDPSLEVSDAMSYRFQSFVGPMRGFYVNARNGNSAAVLNSELRMPAFKYFMKKPLRNDFLENFQVITFVDVGSAWTGKSPFTDDNLFNITEVYQNPVKVTINNNRDPVAWGYGFGMRSRLLGYFMRVDWAWGVDDGRRMERVFYFSLNLDF